MEREPRTQFPIFGPANEESTCVYTAALEDGCGDPILGLSSLHLTLCDACTGIIINHRKDQDVFNINGGTFIDGALRMEFANKDMKLISQQFEFEDHIALFTFTFVSAVSGNTLTGRHGVVVRVKNLKRIGQA